MRLLWPLPSEYRTLTQRFGANPADYAAYNLAGHEGIDFSCPVGTQVMAMHDGHVSVLWSPSSYGTHICLTNDSVLTLYAHLSRALHEGETVEAGTIIGYSGNTGNSTGPHLHLGVRPEPVDYNNGFKGYVNPEQYLQEQYMGTKLAAGVQVWSDATKDHLKRALYPAIKALVGVDPADIRDKVLPAYATAGRPRPFIWVRKWTDDIAADCVRSGDARRFRDAVIGDYAHWRDVLGCDTVELDNEIICQTEDEAKRHNAFEAEVIRLLAQDGFDSIALNASVGWPKIEHWQFYQETLATAQYIGLHEYGWPAENAEGQDLCLFPWHVLRYRKAREEIRRLGYRLPRILITELGWEGALVNIGHRGFRMPGVDQLGYLNWLKWYDRSCDPEVAYCSLFETGAQEQWKEMDLVGSQVQGAAEEYVRNSFSAPITVPDAEVTQLKAMLAIQPATQKACLERGYTFLREAYNAGDTHARSLAWNPAVNKYIGLWLDAKTWKVTREEVLSDPVTL